MPNLISIINFKLYFIYNIVNLNNKILYILLYIYIYLIIKNLFFKI